MPRVNSNKKRRNGNVTRRRPLAIEPLEARLPLSNVDWTLVAATGPPAVMLSVDETAIMESAGAATFTATLSMATSQPVVVDLAFTGSATMTVDYIATGTQILIPVGSTTGSISVSAVNDLLFESHESIVVEIARVTNAFEAGEQREATVIIDDEEPSSAYPETVLADNPIGYWRLGELTGPTAVDSSSNGLNGTFVGGVTRGHPGGILSDGDKSALFDGRSGYVDVGAHPSLNQLTNSTVRLADCA